MITVRYYTRPGGYRNIDIESLNSNDAWLLLSEKEQEALIKTALRKFRKEN
jgi:hypothetical protein